MDFALLIEKLIPILEEIKSSPATEREIQIILMAVEQAIVRSGIINRVVQYVVNKIKTWRVSKMDENEVVTTNPSIGEVLVNAAVAVAVPAVESEKDMLIARFKAEIVREHAEGKDGSPYVIFRDTMYIAALEEAPDLVIGFFIKKMSKA